MKKEKSSKIDIWMPFYVGDYLADTMHLTAAEHGGYLLLMLHYWKSGPIPDDDARLATISRLGDAWSNARSTLVAFFEQRDGMLVHDRIDTEKIEASDNKDKFKTRAQAAAAKRWSKNATSNATSTTQAMLDECPSPSPSPSPILNTKEHRAANASRLPADWVPSSDDVDFCRMNRPDLKPEETANRFRDYWIAAPGAKGRKLDWPATWRNWVRNENAGPNARASPGKPASRNSGFDQLDYSEGMKNGRIE